MKCYEIKVCFVVGSPHRYNLVPVTQDSLFQGSDGELTKVVVGDRRKKSEVRSQNKEDR